MKIWKDFQSVKRGTQRYDSFERNLGKIKTRLEVEIKASKNWLSIQASRLSWKVNVLNEAVSRIFRKFCCVSRGPWLQTIVEDDTGYRGYRNYGTTNSPRKNLGGIGSLFSRETVAQWPAIPHTASIDNITNPPLMGTASSKHTNSFYHCEEHTDKRYSEQDTQFARVKQKRTLIRSPTTRYLTKKTY